MLATDDRAAAYLAEVGRICATDPGLVPLAGGILAALGLDIADSRHFARTFGVEHSLVLREVQALEDRGRLIVTRRDGRTQRCCYTASN